MTQEAPEAKGQLPKGSSKLDFTPLAWKKDIMRLKMSGKSNDYIAKHMKKQYNYKVNAVTVGGWLRKSTDLAPVMLYKRKEYTNELESQYVDVIQKFKTGYEFTQKIVDSMWSQAKRGTIDEKAKVVSGVKELREWITLANSMLGTLPKDDEQITDIAKGVSNAMKILQKEGIVIKDVDKKLKKIEKETEEVELELPGGEEKVIIKGRVGLDFGE